MAGTVGARSPVRPGERELRDRGPVGTGPLTCWFALFASFVAGTDRYATHYVSYAVVLAVLVAPLWIAVVRRFSGALLFFALVPVTVLSGYVTATLNRFDHGFLATLGDVQLAALLTGVAVVAIMMWCRTLLPWWQVALAYGLGELFRALSSGGAFGPDGWKYHLGVPVAIVVLAIAQRTGRLLVSAAAALALGVLGVVNDARSYMAFCVLAATVVVWQAARASSRRRMRQLSPVLVLGGLGAGLYFLFSNLLIGGYLGAELQAKSVAQVDAAGSLIAGGRPEWAATFQLMASHPGGFGLSIRPNWLDILRAKKGLEGVGLPIDNNGYIDNYMFGTGFNLHSVAAELWANYGVAGAVLALVVLGTLSWNLSRAIARREAGALLVFLCIAALWDLGFGPLYTNWADICVALGLSFAISTPPAPAS